MPEQPHPQPIDSQVQYKICTDCRAKLTLNYYGLHSLGKYGHRNECKECRAQQFRLYRKRKYGAKGKLDDIIRCVESQNEAVLAQVLSTTATIFAYQPETQLDFKIVFGVGSLGMMSMALFSDGSSFREYSYSGADDRGVLLAILKKLGMRLELTEADLIAAKTTIYYL